MKDQPRIAVNAGRTLGALSLLAGVFPIVGKAFGFLDFTTEQLEAYTAAAGVIVTALALFLGVNVEKNVTPVGSPQDDAGNPLTPGPIGGTEPLPEPSAEVWVDADDDPDI